MGGVNAIDYYPDTNPTKSVACTVKTLWSAPLEPDILDMVLTPRPDSSGSRPNSPSRQLLKGSFDDSYQAYWLRKQYLNMDGYQPDTVPCEVPNKQPSRRPAAGGAQKRRGEGSTPGQKRSVSPTPAPYGSPTHVHNPLGTAAAEAAKATVMLLIGEREAAVGAMRTLIPAPAGVVARRRATAQLLMEPAALSELRADLAILLRETRRTTMAVCQAIYEWKRTLRAHFSYFAAIDPDELCFFIGGVDILRKIGSDLSFLPAPTAHDPLLLDWFSEQVPWMLATYPEWTSATPEWASSAAGGGGSSVAFGHVVPPVTPFDMRRPPPGSASGEDAEEEETRLAQCRAAQANLLELAHRHGTYRPAGEALLASAVPLAAPGTTKPGPGERWQYGAFQTLLYGGEVYSFLLSALPEWVAFSTVSAAARVVQRMYRNRTTRRVFNAAGSSLEQKRKADQLAKAKRDFRAALVIQRFWRKHLMRLLHAEAALDADIEGKRQRADEAIATVNRKAFKESVRLRRESALVMIQRRWRMILCKQRVQRLRQQRALRESVPLMKRGDTLLVL